MYDSKLDEWKQKYLKQIEELNNQLDHQKRARMQAEKGRMAFEQEKNELTNEFQSSQSLRVEAERRRKSAEQQATDLKAQISDIETQKSSMAIQLLKVHTY